ncbi:MAG: hypothetical protein U0930_00135 [Pirellulales bacterium]
MALRCDDITLWISDLDCAQVAKVNCNMKDPNPYSPPSKTHSKRLPNRQFSIVNSLMFGLILCIGTEVVLITYSRNATLVSVSLLRLKYSSFFFGIVNLSTCVCMWRLGFFNTHGFALVSIVVLMTIALNAALINFMSGGLV